MNFQIIKFITINRHYLNPAHQTIHLLKGVKKPRKRTAIIAEMIKLEHNRQRGMGATQPSQGARGMGTLPSAFALGMGMLSSASNTVTWMNGPAKPATMQGAHTAAMRLSSPQ